MSKRFDKSVASDFGFVSIDNNMALNPNDNSIWVKTALYDFGWGKESGFYKSPLPDFDTLFELALYSTDKDDVYGAAAIILEKFADDLLCRCETIMNESSRKKEFKRLVVLFNLELPQNRCSVVNKTYEQIQSDYTKWKKISEIAQKRQSGDG
ncbi:MAG: hypothetical protein ACI4IF_02195 [Acutalibacteraceae bacterium]